KFSTYSNRKKGKKKVVYRDFNRVLVKGNRLPILTTYLSIISSSNLRQQQMEFVQRWQADAAAQGTISAPPPPSFAGFGASVDVDRETVRDFVPSTPRGSPAAMFGAGAPSVAPSVAQRSQSGMTDAFGGMQVNESSEEKCARLEAEVRRLQSQQQTRPAMFGQVPALSGQNPLGTIHEEESRSTTTDQVVRPGAAEQVAKSGAADQAATSGVADQVTDPGTDGAGPVPMQDVISGSEAATPVAGTQVQPSPATY
ncbi:hypothetical protein K491DRAFT_685051, partial [Lophiostoma macrostomum CBS 122681]